MLLVLRQARRLCKESIFNEKNLFSAIIKRYYPDLTEGDLEKILTKYDIKETGRFCYNDFLRYFVLTMRSHEGSSSSLLARKKLESPKIQVSTANQLYC